MSATPTPTLEGTQSPSQIEFLWVRYRSLAWTLVAAVMCAVGVNYAIKYFNQREVDASWSSFAATIGLDDSYKDVTKSGDSLAQRLASIDLGTLEVGLGKANESQKPFVLMAVARKAVLAKEWERAESALKELESRFPNHSLVNSSGYPVQVREDLKPDPKEPLKPGKEPQLKPVRAGSAVALVREQIAAARNYAPPSHFSPVEPPADASKVKFELSGGRGQFVIALMPQAPKHREMFLKLAAEGFWRGLAVDEIKRPARFLRQPMEFHLGFDSTKDDDRTKWTTTEPSKNILDFEFSDLSHFAGAVSARNEADGKSCADRFWVAVDEAPKNDGDRVIFGYVVEGLENLKRVCEATLSAQDEERGQGRPTENIRIESVTVL